MVGLEDDRSSVQDKALISRRNYILSTTFLRGAKCYSLERHFNVSSKTNNFGFNLRSLVSL